jgi:hypothetical protein
MVDMKIVDMFVYEHCGQSQRDARDRSRMYVEKHLTDGEVGDWAMSHENIFSENPVDAAREVGLLMAFHELRERLLNAPLPTITEFNGEMRGWYGLIVEEDPDGKPVIVDGHMLRKKTPHYVNQIQGEIPWKCFHDDPEWPCIECKHHQKNHYDDATNGPVTDATLITYCDVYGCDCGERIGR